MYGNSSTSLVKTNSAEPDDKRGMNRGMSLEEGEAGIDVKPQLRWEECLKMDVRKREGINWRKMVSNRER